MPSTSQKNYLKAYCYMLLAGLSFALMLSSSRVASAIVDPLFIAWLRGLGGALIILPYMRVKGISLLGNNHKKLLLRSLLGTASVCFVFYSASLIPVADAVSLFKTSTLYVPFLAAYFLKENFDSKILFITCFGFTGVLLVIQPGFSEINLGIVLALIAGFLQALIFVTLRGLSKTENSLTTVGYFLTGSAVALIPFVTWPEFSSLSEVQLSLFATVIAGLVGQLSLTAAYSNAPASRVTPFLYSEVLFSAFFGWIMLNELPDIAKSVGMLIICSSGILLATGLPKRQISL